MQNLNQGPQQKLLLEILRYLLVGGTAFIVDSFIIFLCEEKLFNTLTWETVYLSTALGFVAGLIYNYVLSICFVFQNATKKTQGRRGTAFIIFGIIGVIGLALTEAGMYIGVKVLGVHYLFAKIVVAGVVLLWNYIARKQIIFR